MAIQQNKEIKKSNDAVLREQVRLLINQVPTMQAASLLVAVVLCYTVRDVVVPSKSAFWLLLLAGVVIGRILLSMRFRKVSDKNFNGEQWGKAYLLLTVFSGVVWGLSAFLIFPAGDTRLIALFVLVMASLSAATTVSHSAIKAGPAAWMVPVMVLYSYRCFQEATSPERIIASLIILYLVTLLRYSSKHYQIINDSIALKFENLRLLEEVRKTNDILLKASTIDALTGLANRRKFDDFVEKEWRRALRNKKPLSLILLDIDHFKPYNDNYGHQAGDECLKKVAVAIRDSLKRPSDFAARYGGEEFVVVLPDTSSHGAESVAEKLRRNIELLSLPHAHSAVSKVVTLSAGAGTMIPTENALASNFIKVVDEALYAAKQGGRNSVKIAAI